MDQSLTPTMLSLNFLDTVHVILRVRSYYSVTRLDAYVYLFVSLGELLSYHQMLLCQIADWKIGKTTQSVHCTITGPCLRMHHRPSARRVYR